MNYFQAHPYLAVGTCIAFYVLVLVSIKAFKKRKWGENH